MGDHRGLETAPTGGRRPNLRRFGIGVAERLQPGLDIGRSVPGYGLYLLDRAIFCMRSTSAAEGVTLPVM